MAEAKPKPKAKPAATVVITVAVMGGMESFYRGGRMWTKEPQTVPISAFTDEQLEAIQAEPLLRVTSAVASEDDSLPDPDEKAAD